ncbi:hypothetical protein AB0L14_21525 [Streptomyces sp. NPDC052727]|uniref:hypothetical protein n=1 Tax=Streptomyces sp. NPDC052727 TaxID=3154854 RepID=UPI00341A630A
MIKQVYQAAVVVAAVLVLSGCGGAESGKAKPSASPVSTPAGGTVDGTPSAQDADDKVDATLTGSWASFSSGPPVVLRIEGSRVELLGESHCRGTLSKEDGGHVIRLKCDDGNADRTLGKIYRSTASTMTVDWQGFGADSMQRTGNESFMG